MNWAATTGNLRLSAKEPIVKHHRNSRGTRSRLDRLAGAEHKPRAAYAVDVLWRDVRRNKQREALKLSAGAWNPIDHPELARGGAAHVEEIRSEPDERFDDAIRRNPTS